MDDILSPPMAFGNIDFYNPQATISLSDTSLQNSLMTPEPTSPDSSYNVKEEDMDGDESKKTMKKRKSWGQELPTPKTNLPPRKRAKTEDEKEQRRIERVLRNRQAAQSSRERKRQEVEKLEGEKSFIEQQNESLKERLMAVEHEKFLLAQKLAKMAAQMEAIKRGSSATPLPDSPPLGPDLLTREQFIKQELLDDYSYNLPTPQNSHGAPSTSFSSPSTATYSESSTPATMGLDIDALTATPDMTQHPAAMLCDLQCQSAEACQPSTQPTTRHAAAIQLFSANLLYLILVSAVYSQLMHPLRMIFISLRTGSSLPPSMRTTPMVLPLIRWLISTPANLLPPWPTKAMTPTLTTMKISPAKAMSTPEATRSTVPIIRLRLLRRLLLSSPSLARPLWAATGWALRPKTGSMTSGNGSRELGVRWGARHGEKAGLRGGVGSISRGGSRSGSISKNHRSQKDKRR